MTPRPQGDSERRQRGLGELGRHLLLMLWLPVVWVALWGELTAANVVGGVGVAAVLVLAFPKAGPPPGASTFRPLAVLKFALYFAGKLVQASLIVAWEVVTPGEGINEGIVAVPLRSRSEAILTIVANAISLTPGTLTLEVRQDPPTLYVHVLHVESAEQTRREVRRVEEYALRALAPDADALLGEETA